MDCASANPPPVYYFSPSVETPPQKEYSENVKLEDTPIDPIEELTIVQRCVIAANLNYAEDLAAPRASARQRSRIRKAIQDVIPGISDADRYAVTALLGRYRPEMFTSTRVLTVGAAHELIAWMYGEPVPRSKIGAALPLERAAVTIRYCYEKIRTEHVAPAQ
jgi:hypothetical protein